jgi:hypothetical protein
MYMRYSLVKDKKYIYKNRSEMASWSSTQGPGSHLSSRLKLIFVIFILYVTTFNWMRMTGA